MDIPPALAGNTHAYVPAPADGTVYVWLVPGHTLNTPPIVFNPPGVLLMAIHFAGVLMHPALATTHRLPLVNPIGVTSVTEVDVVVYGVGLPFMVDPAGPVQV